MNTRNIIVVGASTGGLEALKEIIADLPDTLQAAILIVWHMSPEVKGILPQVLSKVSSIPVSHAVDLEVIQPGRIYVAPPDHHLLVEDDHLRITRGPKENRFRPAVDPLFRSAALTYRNQVIGIILSGGMDDGAAGLWQIKSLGGVTIVQDPEEAEAPSMPENALRVVDVDYCLRTHEIAPLLIDLTSQELSEPVASGPQSNTEAEIDIALGKHVSLLQEFTLGVLSPYTCPECHGVLTKIDNGNLLRFRCHTGHAYSANHLLKAIDEKIEDSLYNAIRGMDESILLSNHIGDHFAESNQRKLAASYFQKAAQFQRRKEIIRNLVQSYEEVKTEIPASDA